MIRTNSIVSLNYARYAKSFKLLQNAPICKMQRFSIISLLEVRKRSGKVRGAPRTNLEPSIHRISPSQISIISKKNNRFEEISTFQTVFMWNIDLPEVVLSSFPTSPNHTRALTNQKQAYISILEIGAFCIFRVPIVVQTDYWVCPNHIKSAFLQHRS